MRSAIAPAAYSFESPMAARSPIKMPVTYLVATIAGEELERPPGRLELRSLTASMISSEIVCLRRRTAPTYSLEPSHLAPRDDHETTEPQNAPLHEH
jgi:hypothetical protein